MRRTSPEGRKASPPIDRHHRLGGAHRDEHDQHAGDHRPLAEAFDRVAQPRPVVARGRRQQRQRDARDQDREDDQRFHRPQRPAEVAGLLGEEISDMRTITSRK